MADLNTTAKWKEESYLDRGFYGSAVKNSNVNPDVVHESTIL